MKAEDARKLTQDSGRDIEPKIAIVLGMWHTAIEKAARAGGRKIIESDIGRVRTPIPARAREEALTRLRAEGFAVARVQTGPNESETEVSW